MARRRRVPPKRAAQQQKQQQARAAVPGGGKRFVVALALVVLVGLVVGGGLAFLAPAGLLLGDDPARALLREDTASSLAAAAALDDEGADAIPAAALARVLLVVDHAGTPADRRRAEALLQSTIAAVRTAPEALYARALLARMGADDPALDEDLGKKGEKSKSPWLALARAARALDAGKRDDAQPLLLQAALGRDAPLHAHTELARAAIARGEPQDAVAIAERTAKAAPAHGPTRIVAVLASVLDDLRDEPLEERAIKLKKVKQRGGARKREGPPKPGTLDRDAAASEDERLLTLWRTAAEDDAEAALDAMDPRDAALTALTLQVFAAARGDDERAAALRARVVGAVKGDGPARSPTLAARAIDVALLEGDAALAEELLAAYEAALDKGDAPALALHHARVAALKLIPEEELRRRAAGPRALSATEATFPFGALVFDVRAHGVPFVARFDAAAFPEAALHEALRSGAAGAALAKKLDVVVLVHKGAQALARGDLQRAAEAVAQAREKAAADPDVSFLDARVRLRQADRDGARDAVEAAIAAAPDDPHVLLRAARLHYDNEAFIPARKALKKLDGLGFTSPAALALDAMLDARAGNERSAQAALARARAMGADDAAILRATLLILREGRDLAAARTAADELRAVDALRSTDPILRAWQADSLARAGEKERAAVVLEEIIAQRPNVGDAHYFLAEHADEDAGAAEAFAKAASLAPGTVLALEAAKKKPAPAKNKPRPRRRR